MICFIFSNCFAALSSMCTYFLFLLKAAILSAGCMALVSYAGCNHLIIVILITSASGMMGFGSAAVGANLLDVAHNFAGTCDLHSLPL